MRCPVNGLYRNRGNVSTSTLPQGKLPKWVFPVLLPPWFGQVPPSLPHPHSWSPCLRPLALEGSRCPGCLHDYPQLLGQLTLMTLPLFFLVLKAECSFILPTWKTSGSPLFPIWVSSPLPAALHAYPFLQQVFNGKAFMHRLCVVLVSG